MKKLLILLLSLIIFNCSSNKKELDIENIQINFVESGVSYPVIHRCELIDPEYDPRVFEHKIVSVDVLKEFNEYLSELESNDSDKEAIDSRIKVIINYKDGRSDILCLGENFSTSYNGEIMIDSPELLKLIKDEIKYDTTHRTLEEVLGNGKD